MASPPLFAQNKKISIASTNLALNDPLQISLESEEEEILNYSNFPKIEGFKKVNVSYATSVSTVNNKVSKTYIRTQNYHPQQEGRFEIQAFKIRVNGKEVAYPGGVIVVGPYDESKPDLVEISAFNQREESGFEEVKDKAFIDLSLDKNKVYVGEGFHVMLALYVALDNEAPMKFPANMGEQVEKISKALKPSNCWEENFEINQVREANRLIINGKYYDQYIFYEASFFPLNDEDILLPQVSLEMIVKNKILRDEEDPNQIDENAEANVKKFYTLGREVTVVPLPPHPLRDQVAVGTYYLQENYPRVQLNTGEDFSYEFQILGRGNIEAIPFPQVSEPGELAIYPPKNRQMIRKENNNIQGAKIFSFQIIPKESGSYQLADNFRWIYFNTARRRYDTLNPRAEINVSGENLRNAEILALKNSEFYKEIDNADTGMMDPREGNRFRLITEIIIFISLVLIATMTYLWRR